MAASVTGSLKRYKTYYPITILRQAGEISALRGMASERSLGVRQRSCDRADYGNGAKKLRVGWKVAW